MSKKRIKFKFRSMNEKKNIKFNLILVMCYKISFVQSVTHAMKPSVETFSRPSLKRKAFAENCSNRKLIV